MTLRVAINGFGRIGRNVMRGWLSRGADTGLEIVGMNSTSDPKTSAHLLTYDSILGKLDPSVKIETTDDTMIVNGKEIKYGSRFRTTHDFGYVALDITPAYSEDSGTYMCKASNKLGEAVNTGNVGVSGE